VAALRIGRLLNARRIRGVGVLLDVVTLALAACAPSVPRATPGPANDVAFVIPAGTAASLDRGEPAFQFPDQIHVLVGQSVVITNDDHAMHYFFDIPAAPGQTIRKPFLRTGEFVYQGGLSCSISRNNTIRVQVD
jgi:hypothetical protein